MNRNLTEIVFILDRSGSMSGLESDTIGGYNAMLKRQQEENGEAIVTTVLFDDEYQLLHDRFNINWIKPITEKEYFVGGSTALLDAMGKSIQKIINVQKHTSDDQKADKVLFVITTDGMENASREYSNGRIKKMVEHQKEKYGWEFIFLGANIDAVLTAERFGIAHDRSANYHADGEGTRLNFEAVSKVVSEIRSSRPISKDWKESIDKDFQRRQKK
ncbi:MAG: hypothetical protein KMY55_04605 [Dethiosulfatibacter sp.]|nr:hypothetical protein [Dethiosulfatibacter sp.]